MEKKKDRGINFKYAFLHGSYWLFLQVVLGFMVMIYKEYGFSNMQIGMIGTCIAGGCAIFQPIYGILCDRVGSVKKVVVPMAIAGCVALLCLPFGNHQPVLTGAIVVLVNVAFSDLIPVFDGWGARLKTDGHNLNYGFCRSFGSMFYAFGGLVGILYDIIGLKYVYVFGAVLIAIMVIAVIALPDPVTVSEKKPSVFKMLKFLFRSRRFVSLLVVSFFLYIANNMFFIYYALFLGEMGGASGALGIAMFIMNICEVPVMMFSKKYVKKIKATHLLMISFVFQGIRYLLVSLSPGIAMGIGANVIHGLCFGLMYVALVEYLPTLLDKEIIISAQSILTGVGICGGTVGGIVSSLLSNSIGIRNMYHLLGLLPVIALIIFVITNALFKNDPILKMNPEDRKIIEEAEERKTTVAAAAVRE